MKGLTPMMMQYFSIKDNHKEHILFYRLGDFYEMFFDDALIATKELGLTLTGRDCGLDERAPMCGVPYHSAEGYIAKLIKKGYKVAICEQIEPADMAKGLVTREVVRVITPGTIMESNLLDEDTNNFLCCIYADKKGYGLAFADISTGEVNLIETDKNQANVISELTRYFPREVVFNPDFLDKSDIGKYIKEKLMCTADLIEEDFFTNEFSEKVILNHFKNKSLTQLNLDSNKLYLRALGGLLHYLNITQKTGVERLINLHVQKDDVYMNLDYNTRNNLEITKTLKTGEKRGTLLWVLDKTKTPMGKRLIRGYINQPLINSVDIDKRLNAVEELYRNEMLLTGIESKLAQIHDIERLMTRIVFGSANPREYKTLQQTIENFPDLKNLLKGATAINNKNIFKSIDLLEDLTVHLQKSIAEEPPANMKDGGFINDGFDPELDELRDLIANAKGHLTKLEERERESTGIKTLKVGYNRVFGYFFEVTKSYLNQVPERYIRKQTLANNERYITEELKNLEEKIISANDKVLAIENRLFEEIRQFTIGRLHRVQNSASAIAQLDVYVSFAKVSLENQYHRPKIEMSTRLEIKNGRHPVVEKVLNGTPFVPNDTALDTGENSIAVITGPNMAGKSTYMRQIAIITLMAQIGCFVPADSAIVGIVDGIYTRIGASDDLTSGDSTFMVEMKEVAAILKSATTNSLIILDEIGRGTSTYDGMSIARAVIEYISSNKKLGAKTLFATHYHELTAMEGVVAGVKNYHIVAKKRGDDIIFLRRIVLGGTDDSYGIEVSKLAGVPAAVITRAHEILLELEENRPIKKSKLIGASEAEMTLETLASVGNPATEMLKNLDVETLTPIEALNILYELKNLTDR